MNALAAPPTSGRSAAPTVAAAFKRLHHRGFDQQHHQHEGERVDEDRAHVEELEELEGIAEGEADAVGAAELMRQSERVPPKTKAPAPVTATAATRAKLPADLLNDWTSQAFDLLKAQMKDRLRPKTLATLARRADIDILPDKIGRYLVAAP